MNEYYNQRYEGLREQFRARCRSDADQLEACLVEGGDLETAEMLLHRLAGAGATFGYPEVSAMAKGLENRLMDGGQIAAAERAGLLALLRGLT
ncbi:Hpt domain-containing protein [Hyphobacterium sp. HN65]|uniref:Hpt domain-containing protein n=1 Tax=Hyphobacterium lacteum TaxID=3116575 RepID=A0ABU7LSE0_9PROT|nr:Hpt domain-containing protein [Hyphobacterium sp. HN65]MEE2526808.1 Hpt domain-containing protein [Hyphobacterium sp. HN65]